MAPTPSANHRQALHALPVLPSRTGPSAGKLAANCKLLAGRKTSPTAATVPLSRLIFERPRKQN